MTGFININKPKGMSSAKVVSIVRRKFNNKVKVGHMGTLDPMACGVLPIALGKATRLFDYLKDKHKIYRAKFTFGVLTNTLDTEGIVLKNDGRIPSLNEIKEKLPLFLGRIEQVPPEFSAKNFNGKRAYEIARAGVTLELKPCQVDVYGFECISQINEETFEFQIECGGGTYIRSLCRDLANSLGTCATMTNLIRTQSGVFKLEDAIGIDDVDYDKIISLPQVLGDFEQINLSTDEIRDLISGNKLGTTKEDGTYTIWNNENLCALGEAKSGLIKGKIWFT